jgi:hypothetical protein
MLYFYFYLSYILRFKSFALFFISCSVFSPIFILPVPFFPLMYFNRFFFDVVSSLHILFFLFFIFHPLYSIFICFYFFFLIHSYFLLFSSSFLSWLVLLFYFHVHILCWNLSLAIKVDIPASHMCQKWRIARRRCECRHLCVLSICD